MNFILICPDEMRAESIGCYGHPSRVTPNIDRLAREGTLFEQAHVQHTVCTPSRCSFLTGWYPHVRGHRTLWNMLTPDEPNLLKYLTQAGHHTVWWGKNDTFAPESWAQSVCKLGTRGRAAQAGPQLWEGLRCDRDDPLFQSFLYRPRQAHRENYHDFALTHGAIDFLRSNPTGPFTLNLNLSFPHCPYEAPPEFYDRVDPASLPPLRPRGVGKPDFHEGIRRTRRLNELGPDVFRKINAVYLGMIAMVDSLVGDLMTALDETGLADNTTVVLFSDHGDYAGDYDLVEKWPSGLEDCLTRVPLIIRTPGAKPGHVVREPVELFDIVPTVLDLADLRATHTHFARSLVPQLHGAAGDAQRAVFAEGGYDTHEPRCFEGNPTRDAFSVNSDDIYYPKGRLQQDEPLSVCRATMIRTATHKLIRRPAGASELYDLAADPLELTNRHGQVEYASIQRQLEGRMLDWYIHTADVADREHPRGISEAVKKQYQGS